MRREKLYVISMEELPTSLQDFRNRILESRMGCTLIAGSSTKLKIRAWEIDADIGLFGNFSSRKKFKQELEAKLNPAELTVIENPLSLGNSVYHHIYQNHLTFSAVSEKLKRFCQKRGLGLNRMTIYAQPYSENREIISDVRYRSRVVEVTTYPAAAGRIESCWRHLEPISSLK